MMQKIRYPWRDRLGPLSGASLLLWLALRPAYWPFLSIGDPDTAFYLNFLNRTIWAVVVLCSIGVVDFIVVQLVMRRNDADQASGEVRLPNAFWSAILATLLAKTVIDFTFAQRPFPPGSEHLRAMERWTDVIALVVLPIIYFVARRVGPPSNWPIVKSMVLQPPPAEKQVR